MTDAVVSRLRPLLVFMVLIWAVQVLNWIIGQGLNPVLGVAPCRTSGLIGVPFMPLLHGSWGHLIANSGPLVVLGAIGLLISPQRFLTASIIIVFASGLAVWLFARCGIVVGASGLIFGWFGYLIAAGILERNVREIAGAAIAILFYGGIAWGVLPQERNVSWEAHLFGAIAGGATAWFLRARPARP